MFILKHDVNNLKYIASISSYLKNMTGIFDVYYSNRNRDPKPGQG